MGRDPLFASGLLSHFIDEFPGDDGFRTFLGNVGPGKRIDREL